MIESEIRKVIFSVSRDITERKRLEEQSRVSEESYRTLVAALDEGIVPIIREILKIFLQKKKKRGEIILL